ncbi:hypothetical protein CA13_55630 [Planctomycetes bacterium CA13]|uniref:Uncharacterized protein n=1 Tax=Novipirellula herctigrandis TaxID=2527986 RepID=A0A5C5ZAI3_9BACT|nr:hypothetical protein CA13_55630 [Planctomycetes bacterium CA13]
MVIFVSELTDGIVPSCHGGGRQTYRRITSRLVIPKCCNGGKRGQSPFASMFVWPQMMLGGRPVQLLSLVFDEDVLRWI